METSIETRRVSLDDLKQHNTANDCWIAVHSKVWDITHFINEHPGGPEGMLSKSGVCSETNHDG
jgi:L-lactate dehydrogenase (cytochrome)